MTEHPQAELYAQLIARFRSGGLPASLLITGPEGIGKWKLVYDLGRRVLCALATSDQACGQCASCRQLEHFAHPDAHILFPLPADEKEWEDWQFPYFQKKQQNPFAPSPADPKHLIPIAGIRQFQSRLAKRATLSKYKVGIIYEAERMLPGTMDSLLKLLEEPPDNTFLFVVTDQPRVLLPTILSRLQRITVPRLNDQFVLDHLFEHHQVAADHARILARLARGTLSQIDGLVEGEFFRLRDTAFEMLSQALLMTPSQIYLKFAESAAVSTRDRVESIIAHWQQFIRDVAVLAAGDDASSERILNFDLRERYQPLVTSIGEIRRAENLNDRLETMRQELRRNVNARMAALDFLMRISRRRQTTAVTSR